MKMQKATCTGFPPSSAGTFHKRLSRLCVLCVELVVGGGEGVLLSVFHPSC